MATEPTTAKSRDFRTLLVVGLYFVAALYGVALVLSKSALTHYFSALLMAALAAGWCAADARRRGTPLLPVLQMIMFLAWPIAIPIYLVASRRLRGLAYAVIHAVGLNVVMMIGANVTIYMFHGILNFPAR